MISSRAYHICSVLDLPALLALASVLSAFAQAVGTILYATGQGLQAIADLLRARRAVNGVADATPCSANDASYCLAEATCGIANLV